MKIRRVVVAACVLALAALAILTEVRSRGGARTPPAPARAPADRGAVVVSADEGVERAAAGRPWDTVRTGDVLSVTESIRTGARGTAEIALGPSARITLAERSEVTVRELDDAVQSLGLLRGRIGVEQRPDGTRVLRVEDRSGKVAVTGRGGKWGAVAGGGRLAVAATEGAVRLESGGAAVEVPAGMQAAAWRGVAPLPPAPVPRGVLLKVARVLDRHRTRTCEIQVDAASEVEVNGEPVEVPPDGRIVLRAEGERRRGPEILVRHASGRAERRRVPCDDEADVTGLEVRWHAP